MDQEELTQQKEKMGQLRLREKIILGLILVAVYSLFVFLFFRAIRPDVSPDKPKILTTE